MFLIMLLNCKVNYILWKTRLNVGEKNWMEYLFKSEDGHKMLQLLGLQSLMEMETQGPVNAV